MDGAGTAEIGDEVTIGFIAGGGALFIADFWKAEIINIK